MPITVGVVEGTRVLVAAGALSAGFAALHVAIIVAGGPAYRYFGAGERMVRRADRGSSEPTAAGGGGAGLMQSIVHVALVVRDYDEAIAFYTKTLGFTLIEDTYQPEQDKRWVVVAPPGSKGTSLLLARASTGEQERFVGNQTGGRVFLFLDTDDFWRDYANLVSLGITFVREPKTEPYGTVAVFKDLYGNLWDLLQLKNRP